MVYWQSRGAVLATMVFQLLSLVNVEIVSEKDWVNENAQGTP